MWTIATMLCVLSINWAGCGLELPGGGTTTAPAVQRIRIGQWRLQDRSIVVDGATRLFLLYVPVASSGDSAPTAMPLVFMLHGGGGTARDVADRGTDRRWMQLADDHHFAVAFPQGINKQWNDCRGDDVAATGATANDVAFFSAMIDDILKTDPIDLKRVYSAGVSNGGMMSIRLAIELPERFAAVCSCVGSVAADSDCAQPTKSVPFMYMVGTADPLMPYEGGAIAVTRRSPEGRGTVLSAMDSLAFWRNVNHANGMPTIDNPPDTDKSDGSYVVITTWKPETANSTNGAEVVYYEMIGAGHGWPGGKQHGILYQQIVGKKSLDINGADEAWKFFSRHAKN